MTLAEFDALLDRHAEKRNHALFCAGTVAAAVVNFSMCRKEGSDPVSPIDFLPQKPKTEQEMIDACLNVFGETVQIVEALPN